MVFRVPAPDNTTSPPTSNNVMLTTEPITGLGVTVGVDVAVGVTDSVGVIVGVGVGLVDSVGVGV